MAYTVTEALQACAEALKDECLTRSVGIRVPRSPAGSVTIAQPALEPEGELGGVRLRSLSQALYRRDVNTEDAIVNGWCDALAIWMNERSPGRALQRLARQVFPSVPFTLVKEQDERTILIQYLIVANWYIGRLKVAPRTVVLILDSGRLSLESNAVEWPGGRRRHGEPMEFSALSCMHMLLGTHRAMGARSGSLYRHLLHVLPHRSNEITSLFAAATSLGNDYLNILLDAFDVDWAGPHERPDLVLWDQALRLVDHAIRNPYPQIRSLLVPSVMSRADFADLFGSGKVGKGSPTFPAAARQALRKAVITGQNLHSTKKTKVVVEPPDAEPEEPAEAPSEEAQALLDLQRMLGGSA